jgi:hypothetical protein
MTDDSDNLDLTGALPCAADSEGGADLSAKPSSPDVPALLGEAAFRYIGVGLTGPEFVQYVSTYDFGSVLPDQLIIHNSYIPDASWAPVSANRASWWDRNEAGLADNQIEAKRKQQLDGLMRYYRVEYGWDRGPHLFVDDRWIWLFTPMHDIGIHAKEGNSYHDGRGKLHYSIGIETIGYFRQVGWPLAMQALLRTAVQALRRRLQTFEIAYKAAPLRRPELHAHSIALHADYNKPSCPGGYITPAYAIPILAAAAEPMIKRYVVKRAATAGATIRSAARRSSIPLGRLHAGSSWEGEEEMGETVNLLGFGSSRIWIHDPRRGFVWRGLLDEVKS